MSQYAHLLRKSENGDEDSRISVYINIEEPEVMAIGERLNAINDLAYMNGYNWEALLNHYLQLHHPELLEGLEPDPEAGTYVVNYESSEDISKAEALADIIDGLINDETKLMDFVRAEGDAIEWD